MSSFATGRTTHSVHRQRFSSSTPGLDNYSNPHNIGRHVEDSFKQFDIDMPKSVRNTIDAAREGDLPQGVD